jgi:hypothetical protein
VLLCTISEVNLRCTAAAAAAPVHSVCLQGQTAQRFSSVITLGILSFNLYQPKDLKVSSSLACCDY